MEADDRIVQVAQRLLDFLDSRDEAIGVGSVARYQWLRRVPGAFCGLADLVKSALPGLDVENLLRPGDRTRESFPVVPHVCAECARVEVDVARSKGRISGEALQAVQQRGVPGRPQSSHQPFVVVTVSTRQLVVCRGDGASIEKPWVLASRQIPNPITQDLGVACFAQQECQPLRSARSGSVHRGRTSGETWRGRCGAVER